MLYLKANDKHLEKGNSICIFPEKKKARKKKKAAISAETVPDSKN